jgi:hypothetical protein
MKLIFVVVILFFVLNHFVLTSSNNNKTSLPFLCSNVNELNRKKR